MAPRTLTAAAIDADAPGFSLAASSAASSNASGFSAPRAISVEGERRDGSIGLDYINGKERWPVGDDLLS